MIIYFDEHMPSVFAEGFHKLQAPLRKKLNLRNEVIVKSVELEFGEGVADEEWIPQLKAENACVITQDYNIQRSRHQRKLCEEFRVGMFYLRPPSKSGFSYWKMVELTIKHWTEILKKVDCEPRPFAFKITSRSSKLDTF